MYDANREKGMEILENQIDIQEQTNEGPKGKSSALVVAATCMISFMGVGCRECFICLYCFSNDRQYFSW